MARGPNGGVYAGNNVPLAGMIHETLAALSRHRAKALGMSLSEFISEALNAYHVRLQYLKRFRHKALTRAQKDHVLHVLGNIEAQVTACVTSRYASNRILSDLVQLRAYIGHDGRRKKMKKPRRKIVLG